jgi:hypothetical protein
VHNAVRFQLPELLAEHLLRDVRYRALQLREAHHLAAKQMKEDDQLPSPLQHAEGSLHIRCTRMREYMRRASETVLGGFSLRTDDRIENIIVRYPDRYSDKRGKDFWSKIMNLL